jgi:hypothetical protein
VGLFAVSCDAQPEPRSRYVSSWIPRAYKQNQKPTRLSKADAIPVGDAGGHDGTGRDSDEAVGQPGRYLLRYRFVRSRPGLSHSSSSSHRVPCAGGNLDTPRNSGAADTALANARPVSPPASYLIRPQVTKGLGSWLGSSFVGIPSLRRRSVGPPPSAIHGGGRLSRHPCRSAHYAPPAFSLHPSRDL